MDAMTLFKTTDEQRAEIERLSGTLPMYDIARTLGISQNTVAAYVRRKGLPVKRSERVGFTHTHPLVVLTPEQRREAYQKYLEWWRMPDEPVSTHRLAKEYGITEAQAALIIRTRGAALRRSPARRMSPEMIAAITEALKQRSCSDREISRRFHVDKSMVSILRRRLGIPKYQPTPTLERLERLGKIDEVRGLLRRGIRGQEAIRSANLRGVSQYKAILRVIRRQVEAAA